MRPDSHEPVVDFGMVAGAVIRGRLQLVKMPFEALTMKSGRHANIISKLTVRHLQQKIPVHFAVEECWG